MKKRFIISLNTATIEQNDALLDFIKANDMAWWHWIQNTWLIIDYKGAFTAWTIVDEIMKTHPSVHCFVLELRSDGSTWAGFGPNSDKKNMFTWLEKNWKV